MIFKPTLPVEVASGLRLVMNQTRARGRRHILERVTATGYEPMEAVPFKAPPEIPARAEYRLKARITVKAGEPLEFGKGQDPAAIFGKLLTSMEPMDDEARALVGGGEKKAEAPKPKPQAPATFQPKPPAAGPQSITRDQGKK